MHASTFENKQICRIHQRLKIIYLSNTYTTCINVWKLYIHRIYIFVEYIYYVHQRLKNIFVDYNYAYYKFKYIDVFNIHDDKKSTKLHKSWPLVKNITHELQITFLHVITYTRHDIDYMSHSEITSDILRLQTPYHVIAMMTSYTSRLQITYYEWKTCYKTHYVLVVLFIASQSLQIQGSHETISSHKHIQIRSRQSQDYIRHLAYVRKHLQGALRI